MNQLTTNTHLHGGTYKIVKMLGQGSFGITYLAEHTSLGKKVAIKEFFMKELNSRSNDGSITGLSDGSLSYNYAQKFRKEAQNLARMEHPNIVRVTDFFEENATFYYVMEFIEGSNLNDYVKQNTVSESEAISIVQDVASALIYMHEEIHMLHLDLKPGNIMRRYSDGHIYLIDFGLSKQFDSNGAPETSTTIGLGTAGYAPIEQANQAKNGEFRPTIDVYALGATLYKLLTRETPPAASELVSDDELLSNKLKNISQPLMDVVIKAMLPNVKKRIQTIRQFKEMLSDIESNISPTVSILGNNTSSEDPEGTIVKLQEANTKSHRKIQPNDCTIARRYFIEDGLGKEGVLNKLIESRLSSDDANTVLENLSSDEKLYENAEYILTNFDVDREFACEILSRIGHKEDNIENTVDEILTEICDNAKSEANKAMLIGLAWCVGGILLTAITGGAFVFYGAVLWGLYAFGRAAWNRLQLRFD